MVNVNSSTATLTFTAPSLPDGVFTGIVVVMVTAVNRFGVGPTSEPIAAIIGMLLAVWIIGIVLNSTTYTYVHTT